MPGKNTKRLRWALLLIGVAVIGLVAYTGHQALKAKDSLQAVARDVQQLSDQLTAGQTAAARQTLGTAQADAATAAANTSGPGWWLTSRIPGVGPNVVAVRTVADVADKLTHGVLPTVVQASETLKPANLRPSDGRVDLAPIEQVAPAVVGAHRQLAAQTARVQALDPSRLAKQIGDAVTMLQTKLAQATELSDRASRAVRLLPDMLGGHGKRTYLLMFQNNAEIRATGGIPGAFAEITADHGRIRLGAQGDASTLGQFGTPPVPLTSSERQVFGAKLGVFPQDVNFTADFPRTAQLIRGMWAARYGTSVDGVLSTDPVALSYLLAGTGPVPAPGGHTVTADDAVHLLLNQVYFDIRDPARQNAFFAGVARNVFRAVASGQGDPEKVLSELTRAADQQRILVWSAHPAEEALLAPTEIGGVLRTSASPDTPHIGVFLNDSTAAKMDYYLHYKVEASSDSCAGRRQRLTVHMTMTSTAPMSPGALPPYVTGADAFGPPGTFETTVGVYAPVGGRVLSATLDGQAAPIARLAYVGRPLVVQTIGLQPGQTRQLSFTVLGGPGQVLPAKLRVTPGVYDGGPAVAPSSACS